MWFYRLNPKDRCDYHSVPIAFFEKHIDARRETFDLLVIRSPEVRQGNSHYVKKRLRKTRKISQCLLISMCANFSVTIGK